VAGDKAVPSLSLWLDRIETITPNVEKTILDLIDKMSPAGGIENMTAVDS
jgi:hypothetical protein